jgi:hypothetical protein
MAGTEVARAIQLHNAKIVPVYYKMGKFDQNNFGNKYVKAPFKLIQMRNGVATADTYSQYVMPDPIGGFDGHDGLGEQHLYASDTVDDTRLMGREDFGFHTLEHVVMERQELGNWNGEEHDSTDDWRAVHHFDMI